MKKFNLIISLILVAAIAACAGVKHQSKLARGNLKNITVFDLSTNPAANKSAIKILNEPEKAILANLASEMNTKCSLNKCELTSALNLGLQCSVAQMNLIRKYFPDYGSKHCLYLVDGSASYTWIRKINMSTFANQITLNVDYSWVNNGRRSDESKVYTYELVEGVIKQVNR